MCEWMRLKELEIESILEETADQERMEQTAQIQMQSRRLKEIFNNADKTEVHTIRLMDRTQIALK